MGDCETATATSTPSATAPTPTSTATPTATPTVTGIPTPTVTATATPTATAASIDCDTDGESGGPVEAWNNTTTYNATTGTDAVVCYDGLAYRCVQTHNLGAEASGAVTPGTDTDYWVRASSHDDCCSTSTPSVTATAPAARTYSISVNNNYSSAYTLSGNDRNGSVSGNNATVTVNVGDTINFAVSASGHPFFIRVSSGGSNVSTPAATNQGTQNGTVSWTPNTAGTYYYQCGNHSGMIGVITVTT